MENTTGEGLDKTRREAGTADWEGEYRRIFGIDAGVLEKAEGRMHPPTRRATEDREVE